MSGVGRPLGVGFVGDWRRGWRLWCAGVPMRDIGREIGVSAAAVAKHARTYEWPRRQPTRRDFYHRRGAPPDQDPPVTLRVCWECQQLTRGPGQCTVCGKTKLTEVVA
jgi:hypothetical protein